MTVPYFSPQLVFLSIAFLTSINGCFRLPKPETSKQTSSDKDIDVVTFEGCLKEIHSTGPGKEWNDFSLYIFEVTNPLESLTEVGSRINVVVPKDSAPESVFKTRILARKLEVGEMHRVTVTTVLPKGWDAMKEMFDWMALGLTAGVEIADIPGKP
ncbi:MAG: hypothetical protein GX455_14800 [Phycisphaerae bacterium]|nr:hypothetical protein [Phycisphaerae bacterium]